VRSALPKRITNVGLAPFLPHIDMWADQNVRQSGLNCLIDWPKFLLFEFCPVVTNRHDDHHGKMFIGLSTHPSPIYLYASRLRYLMTSWNITIDPIPCTIGSIFGIVQYHYFLCRPEFSTYFSSKLRILFSIYFSLPKHHFFSLRVFSGLIIIGAMTSVLPVVSTISVPSIFVHNS
jgi:hypothetical protein